VVETIDYINSRVRPRIVWYDRKAVRCKRISMLLQYLAAAASIGVMVLLHLQSHFFTACVAALAALSVTVEKIGQFGNLWRSYRLCAEALEMELQLYSHQSGPYVVSSIERDRLLVERIEQLLAREAGDWRSIVLSGDAAAAEANLHKT